MKRVIFRMAGRYAARRFGRAGRLDLRLGYALLRDRRVPLRTKLLALAIGFVAMLAIQAIELPFEILAAALLPVVGLLFDVALDGFEFLVLPIAIAALLLPWLAPREIVEERRREAHDVRPGERAGGRTRAPGPVQARR